MTSNYTPWDQGALSFDVNSSLMSVPNLMTDPGSGFGMSMSPISSVPQTPASPFRISTPQNMYQSPIQSHVPVPVSSPAPVMPSAPPPMTSLPTRSEGPQIRLNPLVMKNNLTRSLPVTSPFKK